MFIHFHPFEPFFRDDTTKLIVGTLPPPRFCTGEYKEEDVLFPYGSKDNLLWRAFDKIFALNLAFNISEEAINQRKEFLIKNKIGICDIVESCKRKKLDASDIGMSEINLRDILYLVKKCKKIQKIVFMGGLCKNSPEYFFRKILKEQNIKLEQISDVLPKINSFKFDGRVIKTISITSPSNAANRAIGANEYYKKRKKEDNSYTTFDFRVEQYKKIFLEKE